MVLDFAPEGKHLVINGVVTSVYRNSILSRIAAVPGFAAKQAEDMKFKVDADSPKPVATANGGSHTFVPFGVEDGGRMGAHAHVALRMLDEYAVSKGRLSPYAKHMPPPPPPPAPPHVGVALWTRRWQQRLSTWLHLILSRQVLRHYEEPC